MIVAAKLTKWVVGMGGLFDFLWVIIAETAYFINIATPLPPWCSYTAFSHKK